MNDVTILQAFKDAIIKTYNESGDYFKPTKGRERSMVFRIAHHLANRIEEPLGLFVDLEPTKCNGSSKRGLNEAIVIPDMVIHKRNQKGYLVAEFKCSNNSKEIKKDRAKLSLFTLKNKPKDLKACCPTYELGTFVYLGNTLGKVEITLFENGSETLTTNIN